MAWKRSLERFALVAVGVGAGLWFGASSGPLEPVPGAVTPPRVAAAPGPAPWSQANASTSAAASPLATRPAAPVLASGTTPAPAAPSTADRGEPTLEQLTADADRQAARRLHLLRHGSEPQRFDTLMEAPSGAIAPEVLLERVRTDASERVRLVAFEASLETIVDLHELRAALEAAANIPHPAIQQDAIRRLAELDERERHRADPALNAAPPASR